MYCIMDLHIFILIQITKIGHSHYTRSLDNLRIKQHRLNIYRDLPLKIKSTLVNKLPEKLKSWMISENVENC